MGKNNHRTLLYSLKSFLYFNTGKNLNHRRRTTLLLSDTPEAEKINGHTYYYYSEWGWVNGKCRRKWQRYLGKLGDIVKACEGGGSATLYADVFQWGLRQVSYALFCSADGHIPLYYDVYEGNRNDAKQFPLMLEKLCLSVNQAAPLCMFLKRNSSLLLSCFATIHLMRIVA